MPRHQKSTTKELPQMDEIDFGSPEARDRADHVEIERPDPQSRERRIRLERETIDWYLRRDYITQTHADALRRWQADAYLAGLMPACIGSYGQKIVGGQAEISDLRLAAQERRANAIKTLQGLHFLAVKLIDAVAVDGKSAGRHFMQEGHGSPNEAMTLLLRACESLAKHYGFAR